MSDGEPERDILREHNYDGIREYDNQLPRWWLWLFALSVVWSVWYIAYFHFDLFGGGMVGAPRLAHQLEAIQEELNKLDSGPLSEEALVQIWNNPSERQTRVANGEIVWNDTACASCHTAGAWGNVGPNLRDSYWMHGNRFTDLIDIITNGSPNNQMQPQGNKITRRQIQDVAFYIVDLNLQTDKLEDGTTAQGKQPLTDRAEHPAQHTPFPFLDEAQDDGQQPADGGGE